MSLPLVFRRAAQLEFDDAAVWYAQRRTGLERDFVNQIDDVLDAISEEPDRYPIVWERDVREAPVTRFPFCIYYRVKPDRIVVLSVFHTSRDPGEWKSRT